MHVYATRARGNHAVLPTVLHSGQKGVQRPREKFVAQRRKRRVDLQRPPDGVRRFRMSTPDGAAEAEAGPREPPQRKGHAGRADHTIAFRKGIHRSTSFKDIQYFTKFAQKLHCYVTVL